MGLVMICVAAPARREAAKKSVGERWDLIWAWVSLWMVVVVTSLWDDDEKEVDDDGEGGGGALR